MELKMKPFNLEAAKRGDPIRTRDGRPAVFVVHDADAGPYHKVLARVGNLGSHISYTVDGKVSDAVSQADLFMAAKKRTVWVNLYPDSSASARGRNWGDGCWHDTEKDANTTASAARLGGKAWPLEIEE
jgi:hypothetical protein